MFNNRTRFLMRAPLSKVVLMSVIKNYIFQRFIFFIKIIWIQIDHGRFYGKQMQPLSQPWDGEQKQNTATHKGN